MADRRQISLFLTVCAVTLVIMAARGVEGEEDLYRVLGVSSSANTRDIRAAYKRLAKQWHPDKNKLPEAKEKFIQINRAYEVLSDDDKRQTYDTTGEVGDSPQPRAPHQGNGYTVFTTGNGFHFRFFTGGSSHRGDAITTDAFFKTVLPNSHHKPYLLNFYTDFCMQCGHVEQLWNDMRKEMVALGVGLGSIHANHHPRVTSYCGVNHVPTVVGVVSGRVIHFHGNIRGSSTMQDFVNNILPRGVVLSISDVAKAESFLSEVIRRNRPRAILFSPHQNPSLRYRLAAFAHQKSADCAFITTHKSWLNEQLLAKFKVHTGAKQLLVFKEDSTFDPSLQLEGFQLKGDMLSSAIGDLKLHLPRLSSQEVFNRVCPADGGNSLCVVLLVEDGAGYNDTITRSFREMSQSDGRLRFVYIDVSKQTEVMKALGDAPVQLKSCDHGNKARPIVLLKRFSSQQIRFDWYDQFCGLPDDTEELQSYLTTLHRRGQLRKTAILPQLLDEEAPGWFGRQLDRVVRFYYDMLDFISVFDPQIIMSVGVLCGGTVLVCVLGLMSGGQLEEENKRSHPRHSAGHRRQRESTPSQQQRNKAPIHYLSSDTYDHLVPQAPKGHLSVVLLLNTHDPTRSRPLAQRFWKVMDSYISPHVKACFLCYKAFPHFLGDVLSRCENVSEVERDARVEATLSGNCVTVLAIIGSRKQLSIFPESLDSCVRNGAVRRGRKVKSVGQILGNTLGFDEENEDGEEKLSTDKPETSNVSERTANGQVHGTVGASKPTGTGAATATTTSTGSDDSSGCDPRVEQMELLDMWMERFFDGSLKRYRVSEWPQWRSSLPSQTTS